MKTRLSWLVMGCALWLMTSVPALAQDPDLDGPAKKGKKPATGSALGNLLVQKPTSAKNKVKIDIISPKKKLKSTLSKGFGAQKAEKEEDKELSMLRRQLSKDSMPIPPRMGAIFIPRLFKRNGIPTVIYHVFDKFGRLTARARLGRKAFVYPGTYTIKVGLRSTHVLPVYRVSVRAGQMTVVRPRWAALIVRVMDERLVQFRGGYDLINLSNNRAGVGTGIGADDALGERVRAWILPPGLYMLVRVGDSYLARTNFFTVQVNPGKMTYFRLIVDRNTGQFLGGGVVPAQQRIRKRGDWRWNFQLNGNFIWNHRGNVPAAKNGHSFSLTAFLFGRVQYNTFRHFFQTTLNVEIGLTATDLTFRKGSDRFDAQAIYIYRLLRFLGPYARVGIEATMFPSAFFFDDDNNIVPPAKLYDCTVLDNRRNCVFSREIGTSGGVQGEDPLSLGGFFEPLLLKEGIGINFQAVRERWLDLRLLFGVGFRQEFGVGAYTLFSSNQRCTDPSLRNPNDPLDLQNCTEAAQQTSGTTQYLRLKRPDFLHREGLEVAVVATGLISNFFTFTTEFEALGQFSDFLNFEVDWRTSLILRLSHYASIIYRLRVRRDPAIVAANPNQKWFFEQGVVVSFSLLY